MHTDRDSVILVGLPNGTDAEGRPRLCIQVRPNPRPGPFSGSDFRDWTRRLCPSGAATIAFQVRVRPSLKEPLVAWDPAPLEIRLRTELWDHVFKDATTIEPDVSRLSEARRPTVRALSSASIEAATAGDYANRSQEVARRLQSLRGSQDRLLSAGDRNDLLKPGERLYDPYMPTDAPGDLWVRQADLRERSDQRAKVNPGLARDLTRLDAGGTRPLSPVTLSLLHELNKLDDVQVFREFAAERRLGADVLAPKRAALRAVLYYHRPNDPEGEHVPPCPPDEDPREFHRLLTQLSDTPALYTRLGLAFDVVLPNPAPLRAGYLRVGVAGDKLGGINVAMRETAFEIRDHPGADHPTFTAASRASSLRGSGPARSAFEADLPPIETGLLRLDSPAFQLVSLDVDGTVLQDTSAGSSAFRSAVTAETAPAEVRDAQLQQQHDTAGLPAVRTAGLSLVYSGREREIEASMAIQDGHLSLSNAEALAEAPFYAEDLVDGYRVDIWDDQREVWRSACARRGRYHFLDANGNPVPLQGPLTETERAREEGFVSSAGKLAEDDRTLVEMRDDIFTWNGWNLSIPRPDGSQAPPPGERVLRVLSEYEPLPRSLTPLRFGAGYRFRCRGVDPCGNSISVEEADRIVAAEMERFTIGQRFISDQVATAGNEPRVFRRFEPVPAPTVALYERLNRDRRPGEQIDRMVVRGQGEHARRWIIAPRAAQEMVEMHGMFPAGRLPPGALRGFRLRPDGSLPTVGEVSGQDTEAATTTPEASNAILLPDRFSSAPERAYYPDPQAWQARIEFSDAAGQPIDGAPPEMFRFYAAADDWPNARPLLLELEGGGLGMPVAARVRRVVRRLADGREYRTLLVTVRPWETIHLAITSAFGSGGDFRGSHVQAFHAGGAEERDGKNPVLTPEARIALVHAVKRPPRPKSDTFHGSRTARDTTKVSLVARTGIDARRPATLWKSASQVDWVARWEERVDDPAKERWEDVARRANVEQVRVRAYEEESVLQKEHDVGDTKHRLIRYRARTISAFEEYFPNPGEVDAFAADGPDHPVMVPSSARPKPPEIAYIVSSFRWEDDNDTRPRTSRRHGAVRIYLKRPWFDSGVGELLGVVTLSRQAEAGWLERVGRRLGVGAEDARTLIDSLVTRWARDPIFAGRSVTGYPSALHFHGAHRVGGGLTLAELAGVADAPMTIIGYEPRYDPERRLWFCDVELEAGPAYNPFVRLALVRYQPSSIAGVELSTVVQAGFAQLPADRSVTVVRQRGARDQVMTVRGPAYRESSTGPGLNRLELRLEKGIRGSDWVSWRPMTDPETGRPLEWGGVARLQADGYAEWTIRISIPREVRLNDTRLLLREYESHQVNRGDDEADPRPADRLVYATVLRL